MKAIPENTRAAILVLLHSSAFVVRNVKLRLSVLHSELVVSTTISPLKGLFTSSVGVLSFSFFPIENVVYITYNHILLYFLSHKYSLFLLPPLLFVHFNQMHNIASL